MTTPLPMTALTPGDRMPEGSRCRAYFSSPMTTVWPALLPPLNLTTQSVRSTEQVGRLALALVSPLAPDDDDAWHGHSPVIGRLHPILSGRRARACRRIVTCHRASRRHGLVDMVDRRLASRGGASPPRSSAQLREVRRHALRELGRPDVDDRSRTSSASSRSLSNLAAAVVLVWAAIWTWTKREGCRVGAAGLAIATRVRDDLHDRDRHRLQHAAPRRRAAAGRRPWRGRTRSST